MIDLCFLLVHREILLRRTLIGLLLLFLPLPSLLPAFAFLFFGAFSNDFFLKDYIYRNLVVLLEVAWDRQFNYRWIILKIKEEAVKMDVDGARPEVIVHQELFKLANATNRALQYFLDKNALLWVHDLIIALFKLPIDLYVFDVENSVVVEALFQSPRITILDAMFILFSWCLLAFDLFLQVIHRVTQLQIVCYMRHTYDKLGVKSDIIL